MLSVVGSKTFKMYSFKGVTIAMSRNLGLREA
jgi:hypothetical protein